MQTPSSMWSYPNTVDATSMNLAGFEVVATDGDIGKVDEASIDIDSACLVVDTGVWIFGKKRMIPAGTIRDIDAAEERVYVDLTKDQIKDAPDYDKAMEADSTYRASHETYYSQW